MKINYQKIQQDLRPFSVPAYDRDKMQETIQLAKKCYSEKLISERIGFWRFIAVQVRFIERWVWLAQAASFLLFLFLLKQYHFGKYDMQPVFLLFSSVAPMIAFIGFPEVLKSYSHNMEEIESCTRFSIRKLMGARMLILGLADLCCLTAILAASAASNGALLLRMILYLFVPFNLTCCACLTVIEHVKNRYDGYLCAIICIICIIVFRKLSFMKDCYEATATGIWTIMFLVSIGYLAIEIVRTFRCLNRFCSKEKTLSVTW
ncbi:MAG: hypothetical protein QME45_13075 [Clostridiales bacterium]|nr:hypothetical protein [Clostridiales bacterium]